MNDDSQLREYFASLRRAEEARIPSFEQVVGRARRRPAQQFRRRAVAGPVLLAAAAAIAFWASNPHPPAAIHSTAPMLADWRAPTDFLLDTPGRELLNTIPEVGRYPPLGLGPFPPNRPPTPGPHAGREHT